MFKGNTEEENKIAPLSVGSLYYIKYASQRKSPTGEKPRRITIML